MEWYHYLVGYVLFVGSFLWGWSRMNFKDYDYPPDNLKRRHVGDELDMWQDFNQNIHP